MVEGRLVRFALHTCAHAQTNVSGVFFLTREYWCTVTGLRYLAYFQEEARHFESCSSQILHGILSAHTHTHTL